MDIFIERFKELKTLHGLTYPQIAEVLGIQTRSVKNYTQGRSKPDYYGLIALANLFDVSLDYLCGLSDDPSRH